MPGHEHTIGRVVCVMTEINRFAVLGGDLRQAYLAESIAADGYFVYAAAFEKFPFSGLVRVMETEDAVARCTHVVLPLPVTRDGLTLNAPYGQEPLLLDDRLALLLAHKPVYGGQIHKLPKTERWAELEAYDYFAREDVAVENAVPTAEGAIEIAMRELPVTLNGSHCLVAGYGRIGKVLSRMLLGLGAKVTVSARRAEDLAWIKLNGMRAVKTALIGESGRYDVIFNTIPKMVFDAQTLALAAENALIVELASKPYGIDLEAAQRLNIRVILAESLPGKVAPQSAGVIIKNAIYKMMRGE